MDNPQLTEAIRLLEQGYALIQQASAADPLAALTTLAGIERLADRTTIHTVAVADQDGAFTGRGYRSTAAGLRDLVGIDHDTALRRTRIADAVGPRSGLDGSLLPPRLPHLAAVFEAGRTTLRHIDGIAKLLGSRIASRVEPAVFDAIEEQLAQLATVYTPREVHTMGWQLLEAADTDGEEPDDHPGRNTLSVVRNDDGTGVIHGEFNDAEAFTTIVTALDARTTPSGDNAGTTAAERNAAALVEVCGFTLDHDDTVPSTGGFRPHVTVTMRLDDLRGWARGALLDHGGALTPAQIRHLLCDCRILPVILDGNGAPIDVGRTTRTIPERLRRAVAARDGGCANPGCDRPVSWSEIHHVIEWQHGGCTDLDNLVMLCRFHHRQIHSTAWRIEMRRGIPEFIPPDWLDPLRTPRRSLRHWPPQPPPETVVA